MEPDPGPMLWASLLAALRLFTSWLLCAGALWETPFHPPSSRRAACRCGRQSLCLLHGRSRPAVSGDATGSICSAHSSLMALHLPEEWAGGSSCQHGPTSSLAVFPFLSGQTPPARRLLCLCSRGSTRLDCPFPWTPLSTHTYTHTRHISVHICSSLPTPKRDPADFLSQLSFVSALDEGKYCMFWYPQGKCELRI